MDAIDALKLIQAQLNSAAGSDDVDVIQRHVARARVILSKALPITEAKPVVAAVSPVAKILNEPRLGFVAEQRLALKKQAR
ncbi:MAG: hypothetical protein ABW003_01670 [Microvirga sp.]